ncbi:MAG: DUF2169 domain-containing protein [Deltaproteobacteria bacterium]|nr:DUF2169 domain-containing protein [Deltaproteobacteria bacterium]
MAMKIEQESATAQQVSGKDPAGQWILSVLVKRAYTISDEGECLVAKMQSPLRDEPEFDPDEPALMRHDTDLFPFKPRTDVVVKGHVHCHDGRRQLEAVVRVGAASKHISVFGDRHCKRTADGKIAISTPEPITRIPLCYTRAYGGRDSVAEAAALEQFIGQVPNFDPELLFIKEGSPFLYPRNPCGRGYLISATSKALDALHLPNLEDPLDLLTSERLEAGSPSLWPRMPLPQATDWVAYDWFPRIAGMGIVPPYSRMEQPFAEVNRNYVQENVLKPAGLEAADAFHLTCGASLGLQLPYLQGGEPVLLQNIHPGQATFNFRLPVERPKIWTDGRKGKLNETQPVIHTLVLEPEASRLSVLWRGSAPALRPYLQDELQKMPFRVEWRQ